MTNVLSFNLKDSEGTQRFFSPRVVIKAGKAVANLESAIALNVGYIFKTIVEGDGYTDTTKLNAGAALVDTLKALPQEGIATLYMPTKSVDRDASDLAKWAACVSCKVSDLAKTAELLSLCKAVTDTYLSKINEVTTSKVAQVDATQPVYFKDDKVKASKKSGGKLTITLA